MKRSRLWCWAAAAGWVLLAGLNCLPNRAAVSPDGRTLYLSLNADAGIEVEDSSNLYALDVQTGRLEALTDSPGAEAWCEVSFNDERLLFYMAGSEDADEDEVSLHVMDLSTGAGAALTGLFSGHVYAWCVPDRPGLLLCMRRVDDRPQWAVLCEKGPVELGLPPHAALPGNVGQAPGRLAVGLLRPTQGPPGTGDAEPTAFAYVVEFPAPAEAATRPEQATTAPAPRVAARSVCVGRLPSDTDGDAFLDFTFSPDGSRLVVGILGEKGIGKTGFYELDPAGKRSPRLLFRDERAYYPQLAPDGGVVYLRDCNGAKAREVALWRKGLERPVVLARLPGKLGSAYTTWKWMDDGKLRIYHLCDEGICVVTATADGAEGVGKLLPTERLARLKRMADLRLALKRLPASARQAEAPAADEPLEKVYRPLRQGVAAAGEAMEPVEKAARLWDSIPAVREFKREPASTAPAGGD